MKKWVISYLILSVLFSAHQGLFAQVAPSKIIDEEESAEVFLEEYTDEFQDTFFEALKQKGIQNYDRAINLLLECKQLDVNNNAVNHELAKTYLLDKKYVQAQQYAVEALISEPEEYWLLANLLHIIQKQGIPFESIQNTIPFKNETLQVNLAQFYFKKGNYQDAKNILQGLSSNKETTILLDKVNDGLSKKKKTTTKNMVAKKPSSIENIGDSEVEIVRKALKGLAAKKNHKGLQQKAKEAIENYPLQPDFYYYQGLALNAMEGHSDAIEILEEGLNYLFDNEALASRFYKELAAAYRALGNDSKANNYLSKVKPGFQ